MAAPRLYWNASDPALEGKAFARPFSRWIQTVGQYLGWYGIEVTFAKVPAHPLIGQLVNISDSNTNTWGATVAGGGTDRVLARWNGTNWTVVGA